MLLNARTWQRRLRAALGSSSSRPLRRRDWHSVSQAAETLEQRTLLTVGLPDPTFNGGQVIYQDVTDSGNSLTDTAKIAMRQADGKYIVGGISSRGTFFVPTYVRYNVDGTLDGTFGQGGIVTDSLLQTASGTAIIDIRDATLQADGKFVVVGELNRDFVAVRYNSNGSRDTSFGTNGQVSVDLGANFDAARAVEVQADGKIVLGGNLGLFDSFALARLNADGSIDTTFGTGGNVITNLISPGGIENLNDLVIQPDGRILAVGDITSASGDMALVRYNTNGTLDTTFGTGGIVVTDFTGGIDRANTVTLQPDGRIVVGGQSNSAHAYARYNTDGTLDTTFGNGGKLSTSITGDANRLLVQSDGSIIAAGQFGYIVRLTSAGQLDLNFNLGSALASTNYPGLVDVSIISSDKRVLFFGSGLRPATPGTSLDYKLGVYIAGSVPPTIDINLPTVTVDEGAVASNGGSFTNPSGDPITFSASVGTVLNNGNGQYSWSYNTTDGPIETQTVTITATVGDSSDSVDFQLNVNNLQPFVAGTIDLTTAQNRAVIGQVQATDVPADSLTYSLGTAPANGTATVFFNGFFRYTPRTGFAGNDTFTVKVDDGDGGITNAVVNVLVQRGNVAPIVGSDRVTVIEGGTTTVNLAANDSDPDGDPFTVTATSGLDGFGGAVVVNANGALVVNTDALPLATLPVNGETREFNFTYTQTDSLGASTTGTATLVLVGRRGYLASGSSPDANFPATISLRDPRTAATREIQPFDGFFGGVKVAMGDVTGDGVADIVAAVWTSGPAHVRVYDGITLAELKSFYAFPEEYLGGVNVAAADMTGDGKAEIIIGAAGPRTIAHVRIFDGATAGNGLPGTPQLLQNFNAFDGAFIPEAMPSGVKVAAGDVTGDGKADLIVAPGNGVAGPQVKVFDGITTNVVREFSAFPTAFTGGINIGAGDVNNDGRADIIVGVAGSGRPAGATGGAGPHVKVFDGVTNAIQRQFYAFDRPFAGGVKVGAADLNRDGFAEVVVSAGGDVIGPPHVKAFDGRTNRVVTSYTVFTPSAERTGTVSIAAAAGLKDTVVAGSQLFASGTGATGVVNQAVPNRVVDELLLTVQRLASSGLSSSAAQTLRALPVRITNLQGDALAAVSRDSLYGTTLLLSINAAGRGWAYDAPDAFADSRYSGGVARPGTPAVGRIDMLTALGHQLGKVMGATGEGPMSQSPLPVGIRRLLPGNTLNTLYGSDPSDWLFA